MHYSEKAYAKINLFLEITGKRPDGYHTLSSIMQTVGLHDQLEMDVEESTETQITMTCDKLPADESNLAFRAAKAFIDQSGCSARVHIDLQKQIPIAAGLGGGSADAAAVLRVMNRAFPDLLDEEQIQLIATGLGADVPFCYRMGTCLCEGIGEQMAPIENLWNGYYVVARGNSQVSTPAAYRAVDAQWDGQMLKKPDSLILQLQQVSSGALPLFNRFESVIEPSHEDITIIKKWMKENHCQSVLMSGSGPSVVGLFADEKDASKAARTISEHGWFANVCQNQI